MFYTGLYRALTFPRRLDEPGDSGPSTGRLIEVESNRYAGDG